MRHISLVVGLLALTVGSGIAQQPAPGQPPPAPQGQGAGQGRAGVQGQPRDRAQVPQGTASIAGRVLTADTGRPVKRARVVVSGGGRGGRTAVTDDQGRYRIAELGASTYTIIGSKTGFVDGVFGQRRPLQAGTPVQLAEGQEATNVDLRLIRGGVITGRVLDEDGEALARALVTVQRYQYVRGERQLTPAGGDQSDDRGQYRVFGLPPGDYYVSATANGLGQLIGRGLQQLAAGIAANGGRGGRGAGGGPGGGVLAGFGAADEPEATGYAPTYYPGVVSAPEAGKIAVESTGTPAPTDYSTFRIDVPDLTPLPMGPGGGGRGGGANVSVGRAEKNGAFQIPNLLPGKHFIRVTGGGQGGGQGQAQGSWTMKSVIAGGQDVTDQPVELKPGQNLDNVTIVLTDRTTEISGAVRDGKSTGIAGLTVIAFSSDPQYWRAQSRHIQTARTDQAGAYRLRNLPPGDYLIVAVDDVEQGEWFDPAYLEQARTGAKHVSLSEGEKKAQDLRGPGA